MNQKYNLDFGISLLKNLEIVVVVVVAIGFVSITFFKRKTK